MPNVSPAYCIVPPHINDLPEIVEIYAHAVLHGTASFELTPPDLAEMTKRFHVLVDNGLPYFVAKSPEGVLLGYAYAGAYRPRPAYRFTLEDSVYIVPDAQGLGLGRALLEAVIHDAEDKNFRQMIAVIGDSKHKASIALHEKLGFAPAGVFKNVGWKQERWLDSVLMQRPLGDGAEVSPKPGL
ncbi:MAG: N-acetyltransferase family protein [Hyphomicrobiales bacterium]